MDNPTNAAGRRSSERSAHHPDRPTPRPTVGALALAMVLSVVACGSDGDAPTAEASDADAQKSSITTESTTSSTTMTTTNAPEPPLSVGLAAQFADYEGGGNFEYCTDISYEYFGPPPTGPYVGPGTVEDPNLARGAVAVLCVHGFDPSRSIGVEVVAPGGGQSSFEVVLDGTLQPATQDAFGGDQLHGLLTSPQHDVWQLRWVLPSSSAAGAYQLTARQEPLVASSTVTVVEPSRPHIELIDTTNHDNRTAVDRPQWAASGFAPGEVLNVGLYRDDNTTDVWRLVEPLPQLTVDDGGAGILEVSLDGLDPAGTYCVVDATNEDPGSACGVEDWFTVAN